LPYKIDFEEYAHFFLVLRELQQGKAVYAHFHMVHFRERRVDSRHAMGLKQKYAFDAPMGLVLANP
jgi:hypothetical protein